MQRVRRVRRVLKVQRVRKVLRVLSGTLYRLKARPRRDQIHRADAADLVEVATIGEAADWAEAPVRQAQGKVGAAASIPHA